MFGTVVRVVWGQVDSLARVLQERGDHVYVVFQHGGTAFVNVARVTAVS